MWLFPTGQTLAGGVTEYRSRQHASELGQVEARIETLTAGLDSGGYAQGIDEPGQQAITRQRIEGELAGLRRAQATLALQPVAEKESNELAARQLAAHLVVTSLDEYFLPLVYGLLGAAMFVLRRLSEEIRHLTYRADSEILYGLRITMGALAGLTIGWFLRPESSTDLNILPGLSLAFLVGYNVEVLFSAMDRVIATVSKRQEEKVATAEKAAG